MESHDFYSIFLKLFLQRQSLLEWRILYFVYFCARQAHGAAENTGNIQNKITEPLNNLRVRGKTHRQVGKTATKLIKNLTSCYLKNLIYTF